MAKVYCNPKITLRDDAKNRANIMASRAERLDRNVDELNKRLAELIEAQRFAQEVG